MSANPTIVAPAHSSHLGRLVVTAPHARHQRRCGRSPGSRSPASRIGAVTPLFRHTPDGPANAAHLARLYIRLSTLTGASPAVLGGQTLVGPASIFSSTAIREHTPDALGAGIPFSRSERHHANTALISSCRRRRRVQVFWQVRPWRRCSRQRAERLWRRLHQWGRAVRT